MTSQPRAPLPRMSMLPLGLCKKKKVQNPAQLNGSFGQSCTTTILLHLPRRKDKDLKKLKKGRKKKNPVSQTKTCKVLASSGLRCSQTPKETTQNWLSHYFKLTGSLAKQNIYKFPKL